MSAIQFIRWLLAGVLGAAAIHVRDELVGADPVDDQATLGIVDAAVSETPPTIASSEWRYMWRSWGAGGSAKLSTVD